MHVGYGHVLGLIPYPAYDPIAAPLDAHFCFYYLAIFILSHAFAFFKAGKRTRILF